MSSPAGKFVSRGGLKLQHALDEFRIDVTGMVCADFGCNVGGFSDCLLQRGAKHVYAVDTGYGAFAYKLRIDPRVTLMERTNVLHVQPPEEKMDLVVIDLAWTRQQHCLPIALRWLAGDGAVISLIKPHYEVKGTPDEKELKHGVLADDVAEKLAERIAYSQGSIGLDCHGLTRSPVRGGAGRKSKQGNSEYLAWFVPRRGSK